jgi:broad specificity phosphatase PhoE
LKTCKALSCRKILIFFLLIHCGAVPATLFYIVRHGQTEWNVEKRIQGCSDIPLNDVGRAQAVELKEKLKDIDFAFCFSSDLQRAAETARIILSVHPLIAVQFDKRLRQRNYGPWEGSPSSEYYAAALLEQVEKDAAIGARAMACLEEIVILYPHAHVLIVTHGGVMRNVIAKLCSLEASEIQVENTALLKLNSSEQGLEIVEMQGIEASTLRNTFSG